MMRRSRNRRWCEESYFSWDAEKIVLYCFSESDYQQDGMDYQTRITRETHTGSLYQYIWVSMDPMSTLLARMLAGQ